MLSRLAADTEVFAKKSNGATAPRCLFLRDAEAVVRGADGGARTEATAQVLALTA
jgi:hypothetical protein